MRLIKCFILIFALLFSLSIYTQTTLLGKITNNKGEPIVEAIVYLDSIKTDTVSNVIGCFQIEVHEGVKEITIFSPKYGYLSVAYSNEERLSFMFLEPKMEKDTQIVSGYEIKDKKDLGSNSDVLNIKDDRNAFVFNSIYDYIRGRIAGVKVTDSNEIIIRGKSSFELSSAALLVVDGIVVSNLDNIAPIDVDFINVLKGPNASIYGSRGGNGVIEISTKKQ